MAETKTIASLIGGIQENKTVLVNKAKSMGLFIETDAPSLAEVATAVNNINVHDCENYTVPMGTQITIAKGYHTGCTITGGAPEDVETTYKLEDITVDSPIPGGTSKVISKSSNEFYGIDTVTINPPDAKYKDTSNTTAEATDILAGKIAVTSAGPVTGTMPNNEIGVATLDPIVTEYKIPKGYHDGTGKVNIYTEEKVTISDESEQTVIYPNDGAVISKVTVNPIPEKYSDITGTDASSAFVLTGKTFFSEENGFRKKGTGSMANNAAVTASLDGINTTSYTVPTGYHNGSGTVTFDDSAIIAALAAI